MYQCIEAVSGKVDTLVIGYPTYDRSALHPVNRPLKHPVGEPLPPRASFTAESSPAACDGLKSVIWQSPPRALRPPPPDQVPTTLFGGYDPGLVSTSVVESHKA